MSYNFITTILCWNNWKDVKTSSSLKSDIKLCVRTSWGFQVDRSSPTFHMGLVDCLGFHIWYLCSQAIQQRSASFSVSSGLPSTNRHKAMLRKLIWPLLKPLKIASFPPLEWNTQWTWGKTRTYCIRAISRNKSLLLTNVNQHGFFRGGRASLRWYQ